MPIVRMNLEALLNEVHHNLMGKQKKHFCQLFFTFIKINTAGKAFYCVVSMTACEICEM